MDKRLVKILMIHTQINSAPNEQRIKRQNYHSIYAMQPTLCNIVEYHVQVQCTNILQN